jgi:aryl-alcohol dehydrogenase-like predicted oxidoreductase
MKKRALGKTGLEVTELSLGGLFVSKYGAQFDEAKAAVKRAVALGVNYIDTAPGYADSEEVLGKILVDVDAPLIISTKLGGRPQPFLPQNKECLLKSVEESLRLLHRKQIDMLMIHEPDRPGQYDWWSDADTFYGPVLDVLDQLKKDGTIRFTGLGGTTAYEIARVMEKRRFDVVLTAFNYSLLWREAEQEVLPLAAKQNMGIVIGSPLQQGALARRYDDAVNSGAPWMSLPRRKQYKALYAFLDEVKLPIAEAGLRFVISNPHISCVLMGARSAKEVEENVAAVAKGPLPKDILKRLDEIAAMVPFRPFEEPFGLPFHSNKPNRVGMA